MTKQIVITVFTIGAMMLGTNDVQAQNTTATTTVNITLNDVISIDAGNRNNFVPQLYMSAEDFKNFF